MTERTRDVLRPEFKDGERPSGNDFADLIDSCLNKSSDGLGVDADGNLTLTRGLRLGDSAATAAGGLRFNSGQLQLFTSGAWTNVMGGSSSVFTPIGPPASGAVQYSSGNVGINTGTASPPTFRFEVTLGAGATPADQVRFGNLVCCNGTAAFGGFGMVGHQSLISAGAGNANYALRQSPSGATHINASNGQVISFRQNGANVRAAVSAAGNVIVGGETELAGAQAGAALQVAGGVHITADLQVVGTAEKTGGGTWGVLSDARLKKDVRDLEAGLAELRQVRPVRFRYNGAAGMPEGMEGVGVVAQEVEKVLPETVRRVAGEKGLEDLRVFDASPLTFMLINAVKELAGRVERLESALGEARGASAPTATRSGKAPRK
jgi:hypothetical protein